MKEFVEKLIERLENRKQGKFNLYCDALDYAIRTVNELAEEYKPCTKSCTDCEAYDLVKHNCPKFCKVIKETVEEVKENYSNGWIPCSERLPEEKGDYLVTCNDGKVRVWWFVMADNFKCWRDGVNNLRVIAWQPLPEPYMKVGVE